VEIPRDKATWSDLHFRKLELKLLDLKLFHGLRTTEEPSLRSSLKSFHKEYPSFQPVQEHLLLLSSPPVSFASLSSSSTCPHLDVSSLLLSLSVQRIFRFFISIVFCYFTFLEMCMTGKRYENLSDPSFLFEGAYSSSSILERLHSFLDAKNCWAIG